MNNVFKFMGEPRPQLLIGFAALAVATEYSAHVFPGMDIVDVHFYLSNN